MNEKKTKLEYSLRFFSYDDDDDDEKLFCKHTGNATLTLSFSFSQSVDFQELNCFFNFIRFFSLLFKDVYACLAVITYSCFSLDFSSSSSFSQLLELIDIQFFYFVEKLNNFLFFLFLHQGQSNQVI